MTDNNEEVTYCAVHPDRETGLRCITCNRYMCIRCAVRTPVGYRCRECYDQQQSGFFKASLIDVFLTAAICATLSAMGTAMLTVLPIPYLLQVILAFPVGLLVAEISLWSVERRRSADGHWLAAGSAAFGAVAVAIGMRQWGEAFTWVAVGLLTFAVWGRYRMHF